MDSPLLSVLWICGAPGAGKSVAAWELFTQLAARDAGVAYVEIDQLGMLYPDDDADPEAHGLKCAALDALVSGYAAYGARLLIVSGVVDEIQGPVLSAHVDLTVCLLLAEPDALRQRITERGWEPEDAEEAVSSQERLAAAKFADATVDTTGLSVAATVDELRPLVGLVAATAPRHHRSPRVSSAGVSVLFITGPRLAGSSTIGFGLATRRWQAMLRTAFFDLQQLGFLASGGSPGVNIPMAVHQVAALHELMASRGGGHVVVTGHLSPEYRPLLGDVLAHAVLQVVRLRADAATLRHHARPGRSAVQPGWRATTWPAPRQHIKNTWSPWL